MAHSKFVVAVTYLEWMRWIAAGRMHVHDRIVRVLGPDDQLGFDALMDRASDQNPSAENGYVLAELTSDSLDHFDFGAAGSSLASVFVPIQAVQSFIPLSEQGRLLLEPDAGRARARLQSAKYAELWGSWQLRRKEALAKQRSVMLLRALNLPAPSLDSLFPELLRVVSGEAIYWPNDKAERLKGSSAYAWAKAFGLFLQLVDDQTKQDFTNRFSLASRLTSAEKNYAAALPIALSPLSEVVSEMSESLLRSVGKVVSLRLFAVIIHYRHLLESDRQINLESLLEDLVWIGVNDGLDMAAVAAYAIARSMEDSAVTTLLYGSAPHLYPSLNYESMPYRLNVATRIAELTQAKNDGATLTIIENDKPTLYEPTFPEVGNEAPAVPEAYVVEMDADVGADKQQSSADDGSGGESPVGDSDTMSCVDVAPSPDLVIESPSTIDEPAAPTLAEPAEAKAASTDLTKLNPGTPPNELDSRTDTANAPATSVVQDGSSTRVPVEGGGPAAATPVISSARKPASKGSKKNQVKNQISQPRLFGDQETSKSSQEE